MENENKSNSPKFNIGDIVWAPIAGEMNGKPCIVQAKILGLVFVIENNECAFGGYKILKDEDSCYKPQVVFSSKEECLKFANEEMIPERQAKAEALLDSLKELFGRTQK